MARHEKDPEPWFRLAANGQEYRADRDSTSAFLHADPKYDHIFLQIEDNDAGEEQGLYVFREGMDKDHMFEPTLQYMKDHNFTVIYTDEPSANDREVYENWIKSRKPPEVVEPAPDIYLSDRQEHRLQAELNFMLYLIDHDLFINDGDVSL